MAIGKHRRGLALASFGSLAALSGPAFAQTETKGLPGPTEEQLAKLQALYEDLHANPELLMQGSRTPGVAAKWPRVWAAAACSKSLRKGGREPAARVLRLIGGSDVPQRL